MRPAPILAAVVLAGAALAGCEGAPAPAEPPSYPGPELRLEAPARGAMLEGGGEAPAPVVVRGQACDAFHAIASVTIGGQPVSLAGAGACRTFEAQVEGRWGLSIVRGQVVNDAGEVGGLAQAFLRSPGYFGTAGGDPSSRAGRGVLLQVGQELLDDGDRATPDDVATVAEQVLGGLDVDAAVGSFRFAQPDADGDGEIDAITHSCVLYTTTNKRTGFRAWKNGPVTHGGIRVDRLQLEDGGLGARITVRAVRVPFGVTGNLDSGCLGDAQETVTGDARADALVLEGHARMALDAQGRPQATFEALPATLSGLDLAIDLGPLVDWTGLGDLVGDAIAAQVRGPVQEAIRGAVQAGLEGQISRALAALASFRREITLPAALGGVELVVEAGLDRLDFTAERGAIGTSVQVRPASPRPEHAAAARGAIRLGGARAELGPMAGASVALGVADDVLNQFLHAAWMGGAFDAEDASRIVSLAGLPIVNLALFSSLPPVLMPRPDGAAGVDLGWGDVAFDLALDGSAAGARARGYLSLVVGLERLEIDPVGRTIRPVFAPGPEVHVQVTEANWDHLPTTRAVATRLLESLVRNGLSEVLSRALGAFPLPDLDLRALDPGLPPLVLSLQEPRTSRLGRYQVVAGRVAAR
jgi:hypothetical protein